MSSFKEIAKGSYHFLRATKNVVEGVPAAIKRGMGESYFPEKQSKTTVVKVLDNLGWLLKYHEVNDFYYLYGMDLVGSKDEGKFGKKISQHPDTKIEFNKFKVPMYEEALQLACKAHTYFYGVHSIGWDVALTSNGPMFIEGNDNWEISLMQACSKGLKKEWMKSFPSIKQ